MSKKITLPHHHHTCAQEVLSHRPDDEQFIQISSIFSIMGDTTRLKILWLLCHCEECVINIAAAMEMSSPAVSHHLRVLKQTGLITSRKEGKEVYYALEKTKQANFVHSIIDQFVKEVR